MFCERCGTKLLDNAEFCINCGNNIKNIELNKKIDDTEIQLRVQPSFKFGYMVLPSLIIYSVAILIYGVFLWWLVNLIISVVSILIGLVILSVYIGIKVTINKKQYINNTYDFYKTKVIYKDNFLNISEKEVKYKNIREVTMNQTFMQRYFNIGNIVLFTNAETAFGNGICIANVENINDVYMQIKSIIDI